MKTVPTTMECLQDFYMSLIELEESYARLKRFAPFIHMASGTTMYSVDQLISTVKQHIHNIYIDMDKV